MPTSKESVTKADLDVIGGELRALRGLMENELRHHADDIKDLRDWRDQFIAEEGPWRSMNNRVRSLEYLAKSIKVVIGVLTPIAGWAIMEIAKALLAWARGGP